MEMDIDKEAMQLLSLPTSKTEGKNMSDELKSLCDELEKHINFYLDFKDEKYKVEHNMKKLIQEHEETSNKFRNTEIALRQARVEKEASDEKNQTLEKEIQLLRRKYVEIEKQNASLKETVERLDKENQKLKKKNQIVVRKTVNENSIATENSKLSDELKKVTEELHKTKNNLLTSDREVVTARNEATRFKQSVRDRENQIRMLHTKLASANFVPQEQQQGHFNNSFPYGCGDGYQQQYIPQPRFRQQQQIRPPDSNAWGNWRN